MSRRVELPKRVQAPGLSSWDFYSRAVFIAAVILQASEWPRLPYFMDCYYHLAVMRGFEDAGGWVGRAFWEYAPFGRPHLYPPLFHIIELILSRAGLGAILIARLSQLFIYPLFLFSAWKFLRVFYGDRLAFFGLFLLISSLALYFAVITLVPFSLAVVFGLWSFYFFERSRPLGCFLSLTLAFYAHPLMAGFAVLTLFLYSIFLRKDLKLCLRVCVLSVLASLPLLAHQLRFSSYANVQRVMEYYYAQVHLLILALAVAGLVLCLKKRGRYLFFVCFGLGMACLFFIFRNRFLLGHGLIPMSFLAAVALCDLWQRVEKKPLILRMLFGAAAIFFFYFLTPVLEISPLRAKPGLMSLSRIPKPNQSGVPRQEAFRHTETFYYPRLVNDVVRLVRDNSTPEEILYSNFNYGGGMISVLAHRATADAMLGEVEPFKRSDPVAASHLILWFKFPTEASFRDLKNIIDRYGLRKVGETDIALLYRNSRAALPKRVIKASVPFWLCSTLLFLALAGLLYSGFSDKKKLT